MLAFIVLTLSLTVAILLASVMAFAVMLNPKVIKWYTKRMMKYVNDLDTIYDEIGS